MRYYTNRELAKIFQINLARWKRWSREFLPPDPLGGLQSGYARQYTVKDAFKIFLAGHLVSDLRMTVPEARHVLADLEAWLNERGFYDIISGSKSINMNEGARLPEYRICLFPFPSGDKAGLSFGYRIKKILDIVPGAHEEAPVLTQRYTEIHIHCRPEDFSAASGIRMIGISRLYRRFLRHLGRLSRGNPEK